MLSALIRSRRSYPAYAPGGTTGTPEVCPFRSSRTKNSSLQISCAHSGYGPNCLTTFWTQIAYHFNGRTAQPLEPAPAPGYDDPTSRCQTLPSIWTLGKNKPVIPGVTFIRWAMTLPHGVTGSLGPTFVPAWHVRLAVKLPYALTLYRRFPIVLREPLSTSVTF